MSAVFAITRLQRTAIALSLCLLAFAFAMEAKLACYSPSHRPDKEVRAVKAFPAELPEVMAKRGPILASAHSPVLIVFFAAVAFFSLPKTTGLRPRQIAGWRSALFGSHYDFHHLFFRPPPSIR